MTRKLSQTTITPPMRDALPALPDGRYSGGTYAEARDHSPIQAGDVVMVLHAGKPKRALIIRVFARHSSHSGLWLPLYRVRLETARGTWANLYNDFYPGDVERGYDSTARA